MPAAPGARRDGTFRPEAIAAFARAFERGLYLEAHEALEAGWSAYDGPDREMYQGLIQAAVALHHASRGNAEGARGVARSCRRRMAPFAPCRLGIAVDDFLASLDAAVEGHADPPSLGAWEGRR